MEWYINSMPLRYAPLVIWSSTQGCPRYLSRGSRNSKAGDWTPGSLQEAVLKTSTNSSIYTSEACYTGVWRSSQLNEYILNILGSISVHIGIFKYEKTWWEQFWNKSIPNPYKGMKARANWWQWTIDFCRVKETLGCKVT